MRVGVRDGAPAMPPPPADPATPARARPLATGAIAATGRMSTAANPRVLAIVVDDLGLSFESTAYVRKMLTSYVDTQVEPGDLVAIIRTAGGVGTLQQFTTDRRLLTAAIDRVRWSFQSRGAVAAFDRRRTRIEHDGDPAAPSSGRTGAAVRGGYRALADRPGGRGVARRPEYVLRGIEELPGRKSVVFVSEGMDLGIRDHKTNRVWNTFTRVMDRANRAGVVVYTVDARGLQTGLMTGEDDPQTPKVSRGNGSNTSPAEINAVVLKGRTNRHRAS